MPGPVTLPCPACSRPVVLIVRSGRYAGRFLIGATRDAGALDDGRHQYSCVCGVVLNWSREGGPMQQEE